LRTQLLGHALEVQTKQVQTLEQNLASLLADKGDPMDLDPPEVPDFQGMLMDAVQRGHVQLAESQRPTPQIFGSPDPSFEGEVGRNIREYTRRTVSSKQSSPHPAVRRKGPSHALLKPLVPPFTALRTPLRPSPPVQNPLHFHQGISQGNELEALERQLVLAEEEVRMRKEAVRNLKGKEKATAKGKARAVNTPIAGESSRMHQGDNSPSIREGQESPKDQEGNLYRQTSDQSGGIPPPRGPPTHDAPASDPSDSSSSSSSSGSDDSEFDNISRQLKTEPKKVRKLFRLMQKHLKRHSAKDRKIKIPDPRPFKGDADDLERFIQQLEAIFDYHKQSFRKDMNRIDYVAPLLEGAARRWYDGIHPHINREAAMRKKMPFNKDSPWRKWSTFLQGMQTSFGGSLTRDKAVAEWETLRHYSGKIDVYLDKISQLMWQTGYSGEVIKDKIKKGLDKELRREWAKAHPKPEDVAGYIEHLRELGHAIENDYLYEKMLSKGKPFEKTPGLQENSGGKKKKKKVNEKPSSSKENADSLKKKSSTFIPFGEATKGILRTLLMSEVLPKLVKNVGSQGISFSNVLLNILLPLVFR